MSIDLAKVSCCLITKEPVYPSVILERLVKFPFGEFLILTHSDSPYRKHELFEKAKFPWLFYCDDDCIAPVRELADNTEPSEVQITLAMKKGHFDAYKNTRMTMGLGWGAFIPKSVLRRLDIYRDKYGEDFLFKRDTEKILTSLCYPQKRLILPIEDLPSATAPDRLWRQENHFNYGNLCEERCTELLSAQSVK